MRAIHVLRIFIFVGCFVSLRADWANRMLQDMTLEEKVGQLFMVGVVSEVSCDPSRLFMMGHHFDRGDIENLIRNYHVGGVIFFHGSIAKQADLTNMFQEMSELPLLVGQDCEWGLGMRLCDAMSFPKNMELGALADESLIYELGEEIGRQCRAIGVHVNFAPVVDINTNPNNPIIGVRAFGDNKEDVARKGKLFAAGLRSAGCVACAKHFPGHGDTDVDSHLDLPLITHAIDRLESEELYPFKKLVDAGVESIMSAHLSVPALDESGVPASVSRLIITDLLREKIGFKGLVFTDAMSMRGLSKMYEPREAALRSILAGNDILLCPLEVEESIDYLVEAVKSGLLSEHELDEHVMRILKIKEMLGLNEECFIETDELYERLHSRDAKDLIQRLCDN